MRILVIGTPKRNFHVGFDNFVLGLVRSGVEFDYFPNILEKSLNKNNSYSVQFEGCDISYPDYRTMVERINSGAYGLIITTVCHVDYKGGRHGVLSYAQRKLKYSLESKKHMLGGTILLDWMAEGLKLPPFVVLDDTDDSFIHEIDLDLLENCLFYFKRELPIDKFFCLRLFESKLNKEHKIRLAKKILPVWIAYDRPSIESACPIIEPMPFNERDIDISFLCNVHMSYNRLRLLPLLEELSKKYKVVTTADGKLSRPEFYETARRSRISISLEGRGWDCPKHYELMLCGSLLFVTRPYIELAYDLEDGVNCVFVDTSYKGFARLVERYLSDEKKSMSIISRGYTLAKDSLSNKSLADYVLGAVRDRVGGRG